MRQGGLGGLAFTAIFAGLVPASGELTYSVDAPYIDAMIEAVFTQSVSSAHTPRSAEGLRSH